MIKFCSTIGRCSGVVHEKWQLTKGERPRLVSQITDSNCFIL